MVYLKDVIIIYYCSTTVPPIYSLESEDCFEMESVMVWGIKGNSQKKSQKSKNDEGQRDFSAPFALEKQYSAGILVFE